MKEQLQQMVDPDWLQKFKEDYPVTARQALGVPQSALLELARTYGRANNGREVAEACAQGDTFEEKFLSVAVLVSAQAGIGEILEAVQAFMPAMDSVQLCDAACLALTVAREHPEEVLAFLRPWLEGDDDLGMRFAIVMLLDHFINTDYIDAVLVRLLRVRPCGVRSWDAFAWLCSVCYLAYPLKTYVALEQLTVDEAAFLQIVQRIEASPRLQAKDRMALEALKMNRIPNMTEQ